VAPKWWCHRSRNL